MLASQLITVENQSTVLTPKDVFSVVWGVNYQVLYQYNRSGWVKRGLARPGHVVGLPRGVKPPAGAWNVILLDHSDQQGALGYHDDEQGTPVPYAEVFAVDARQDGASVSSVASHEALEMLVDPFVDPAQPRTVTHDGKLWIVEVCDAVQGNDYDVGAPEGHVTGVMVSDFCLPSWFGLGASAAFSFRGSVPAAFSLAPQGYISTAPLSDPSNWSQSFGQAKAELPRWASRLPRVHGTKAS